MFNQALFPLGEPAASSVFAGSSADAALDALLCGRDLATPEAFSLFSALVAGILDDAAIAGMLVALRIKGVSSDELIGAAHALRQSRSGRLA